jgi:glycosyltransferase involved in cell wall biosynthesis
MQTNPLVSVLMTAYNREKYIAEAIESVLNSTYKNFELIIVDDGSADETLKIIKQFAANDDRIQFYLNDHNLGDYANRNKAAGYAKGWLMFYVDSDDTIQTDALEYVVQQFQLNSVAKFSTIYYKSDINVVSVVSSKESIRKNFYQHGFLNVGPGGTVIQTSYFKAIGGFPEKYGPVEDMYYNLKAAANTNILLLPYKYHNYRRHSGQEYNNKFGYLCNGFRYLVDVMELPELPLSKEERNKILKISARKHLRSFLQYVKNTGNIKTAIKAFRRSKLSLKRLL